TCGSQLTYERANPGAPQKCFCCGATHYHNSKPCAGALIVAAGRVLLAERAVDPGKGAWDVPGGFLEPGEHPEDGTRREVREETGLDVSLTSLFAILTDHYGESREPTLNLYYLARIESGTPTPANDVASL